MLVRDERRGALVAKRVAVQETRVDEGVTLARCAREYHDGIAHSFKNQEEANRWINALAMHWLQRIWLSPRLGGGQRAARSLRAAVRDQARDREGHSAAPRGGFQLGSHQGALHPQSGSRDPRTHETHQAARDTEPLQVVEVAGSPSSTRCCASAKALPRGPPSLRCSQPRALARCLA